MNAAAAFVLCLVAFGTQAQPVYRCGNAYSQVPCPQGKVVDATDPRSAAQRAEGAGVAADERRRAAEMKRERLADLAAQRPAAAASLSAMPAPAAKPASAAERRAPKKKRATSKPSASTPFTAADPAARKQPRRSSKP